MSKIQTLRKKQTHIPIPLLLFTTTGQNPVWFHILWKEITLSSKKAICPRHWTSYSQGKVQGTRGVSHS